MIDELDDKRDIKKYIRDTVTYIINKKMNTLNNEIGNISNKIDKNIELTVELINLLLLNNSEKNSTSKILKNFSTKSVELLKDISNDKNNLINMEFENDLSDIDHMLSTKDILIGKKEKEKIEEKPIKIQKPKIKKISCGNALYKEVKVEDLNIDPDFIKECLSTCSLEGDVKLFKKMYIDDVEKTQYPIRHIKKKYQYWLNDKMNDDDSNGTYIKNTVIKNIEQCYLSVNIYIDNDTEIDDFIKNQEYITKLSEQKYKELFLKKIVGIITI
jgi:hypothetical protein